MFATVVADNSRRAVHASASAANGWPIALDIGGSLTKLIVRSPAGIETANGVPADSADAHHATAGQDTFVARLLRRMPRHPGYRPELEIGDGSGGALSFLQFETRWMEDFVTILQDLHSSDSPDGDRPSLVPATGGGAFKFSALFKERLGVELVPADEMHALARGMRYFEAASAAAGGPFAGGPVEGVGAEMFTYDLGGSREVAWRDPAKGAPCLLVSVGSGVSVIKVEPHAPGQGNQPKEVLVRRVNGSSVGGATFWGLCRLLTSYRTFDEAVSAADTGDNNKVAMLVSDIYGGAYTKLGLPGDIVAADFGRIATRRLPRAPTRAGHPECPNGEASVEEADLTRAVLVMVLNNVAQVAHSSSREHGIDRIFFGGSFLRRGTMMRIVTSALKFWSGGMTRAAFMQHDGYFGAMGALCLAAETDDRLGLPGLIDPGSPDYILGGPHVAE